jgi:hypothetical protein
MAKQNEYEKFKSKIKPNPPLELAPVEVGEFKEVNEETKQPEADVSGNGHKGNGHKQEEAMPEEPEDVEAEPSMAMTDAQAAEMARQQEDSRRRMELKEVERSIPGNRYLFNREKEHLLETAIINPLQLHNFACARIQTKILSPDWDSENEMVADMYVDTMLEGSIAIDGEARKQFVSLTQFKNEERMQAARGGLFDAAGPG